MTEEIWKPVVGYEGLYEVGSFGNIRSIDRIVYTEKGKKTRIIKGVMLKPSLRNGYLSVCISKDGKSKSKTIHSLICQSFYGFKFKAYNGVVNHKDGNKTNNNIDNLEIITPRINILHKILSERSEKYIGSKLAIGDKWRASISVCGVSYFLGNYSKQDEADRVYKEAEESVLSGCFDDWFKNLKTNTGKSSIYRGVSYSKKSSKWHARLIINKIVVFSGYYNDEKTAATSYRNARANLLKTISKTPVRGIIRN